LSILQHKIKIKLYHGNHFGPRNMNRETTPSMNAGAGVYNTPNTTGGALFAECRLHSAKPLPSATLGKELPSKPFTVKLALPSAEARALGKDFAECRHGTR
jgi:hypothetical protein